MGCGNSRPAYDMDQVRSIAIARHNELRVKWGLVGHGIRPPAPPGWTYRADGWTLFPLPGPEAVQARRYASGGAGSGRGQGMPPPGYGRGRRGHPHGRAVGLPSGMYGGQHGGGHGSQYGAGRGGGHHSTGKVAYHAGRGGHHLGGHAPPKSSGSQAPPHYGPGVGGHNIGGQALHPGAGQAAYPTSIQAAHNGPAPRRLPLRKNANPQNPNLNL